ncbi:hypothetical protein AYO21_09802 [Fonsecaea monophora]|uniref:AMP-dependent synthetase/ligase domain-containing protein n=1 Tax=Fonsecaea monophora TaxID=254056 RepID=A0A177EYJ0_9EURO|nr:hypothetical protein AYO21_09802 [Fonsecaea monophora]OAG36009.1 hypothetical protein AYO21_09802 [Fonsecaea monophora]
MAIVAAPRKLWQNADPTQTNMDKFRRQVNSKRRLALKDYAELHAWSIDPRTASDFWADLFEFEGLAKHALPIKGSVLPQGAAMFPPSHFFPQVRMNFAQHLLNVESLNPIAIYAVPEGAKTVRAITRQELREQVTVIADALRQAGVKKGDRVAAVISNCFETIVACLATLSIGALWSTSSPDMGTEGIMQRLEQIEPKIVFFESSVHYNGKLRSLTEKYEQCLGRLRKVADFKRAVLIIRDEPYSKEQPDSTTWDRFLSTAKGRPLTFEQLPFSHPGFIVYSSGTTGAPKCIVHSACGLLMQVKKDYLLHLDVRPGDTVYQYTTTGWIMWAMVLCGLCYGGSVVVYDGSPLYPDPLVTLRLVEKLKISLFGTSARFLTDLQERNICPKQTNDLSSLRTVSSTGSVLPARVCEWFYDAGFPDTVHLVSGSGGTDLACSLVSGDPTSPAYSGEIQAPALGMAIDILDSAKDHPISLMNTGVPGELVCRQPFPSEPVEFWGRDGKTKYQKAYFERFGNNIWTQGDFVSSSPITGGFTMLGRSGSLVHMLTEEIQSSDGVLNPSGVRFGSAEIYQAIEKFTEFEETICVGQRRPQDNDEAVILFVKMKDSKHLTKALIVSVCSAISTSLSPRHVPKFIFEVPEIPYTINGKKIELAVKQIVSGQVITPSGAVMNPESLKFFERFAHDSYLKQEVEEPKGRL